MPTFYSADRRGVMHQGAVLTLTRYDDIGWPEVQSHLHASFPDGLSMHGEQYFAQPRKHDDGNARIELIYELVRRAMAPSRPSRAESIFGARSVDGVKQFLAECGGGSAQDSPIWEIQAENGYFEANMRLLRHDQTLLVTTYLAELYWKGEAGPSGLGAPYWEVLMVPPVRVVRRVA